MNNDIIDELRFLHRRRRFAMKTQQKITLSTESYVRRYATDWHVDMDAKERARIKKEVQAIMKAARADPEHPFHRPVKVGDMACTPSIDLRTEDEKAMAALAKRLPDAATLVREK